MAKMAADGYVEMDKREYLRIGLEVFGTDDVRQWRFRCPACGLETEGWLFEAAGAKPDELYANCFARFDRDSMSGAFDPAEQGCGWSAYEGDEEVAGAWIIDGVGIAPLAPASDAGRAVLEALENTWEYETANAGEGN